MRNLLLLLLLVIGQFLCQWLSYHCVFQGTSVNSDPTANAIVHSDEAAAAVAMTTVDAHHQSVFYERLSPTARRLL